MAQYNLSDVSFVFCGVPFLGGFGEGGAIKISRTSELYVNVVGVSGDVVRSEIADKSATIEVTLIQTSLYNKTLQALADLQAIGPLLVRDRINGDEFVSSKAWVQKLPDHELGQKAVDRMWTLFCDRLEMKPGGR